MIAAVVNAFRVPDLRKKILYTAFLLFIYRLGSFIPVPGVDASRVVAEFERAAGAAGAGLLSLLDMFAGGALSRFTVFALNVGPYITASIVMELLKVVIPQLEELAKEGVEGRKKISQYTRYLTIVLAVVQGYAYTLMLSGAVRPGALSRVLIVVSMTAGTAFVMWLGEKISEHGIGNGISLIIFTGIAARIPSGVERTVKLIFAGGANLVMLQLCDKKSP
ncbi:MAG: preprotein translocase subunit SecY, partial [Firmicutes bacterium]|nr:preprotein translocase subunit SecY [Bacillota bacterium]